MSRPLTVMLVATEASGDILGAGLARALKERLGDDGVRFVGVGGPRMAAQGVKSPFSITDLSIMGLEALVAFPKIFKMIDQTVDVAKAERPDVAVLIDSWSFTSRVAKKLRRLHPDMPLIKFVSPQVWASRPGRARTLAGLFDHLLVIHGFEVPLFEKLGLGTTFVGSPALAREPAGADPARLRAEMGAGPDDQILLVLPGSRPGEIARMMPPFEAAVDILKADRPNLRLVVVAADLVAETVRAKIAGWRHRAHLVEGEAGKLDAMTAATVALACSGTVTTELAVAGCPFVMAYRVGTLTWLAVRLLATTRYFCLINIAAGKMVAPEMFQTACTPEKLARELALRLDDPALRQRQIAGQNGALEIMGRGGPDTDQTAADAVLRVLGDARAP